jgi:hypothetical protein
MKPKFIGRRQREGTSISAMRADNQSANCFVASVGIGDTDSVRWRREVHALLPVAMLAAFLSTCCGWSS